VALFGIYRLNMTSQNQQTTNMQFPDLIEVGNVNASMGYWECHREIELQTFVKISGSW
jgi:hypothetical protein